MLQLAQWLNLLAADAAACLGHLEGCTGFAQGPALSNGLCLGTPAATRAMAKQISCQEGAVSAPSWHQDCVRTTSLAAALSACSFAAEVLSCSASANRGQNTERATAPQCKPTFLRMAARWVCLSFPWGFLCFRTLWMLMHSCYKDLLLASMLPAPKKVKSQKKRLHYKPVSLGILVKARSSKKQREKKREVGEEREE